MAISKILGTVSKLATKKNLVAAGTMAALAIHSKKIHDQKKMQEKADKIRKVGGVVLTQAAVMAAVANRKRLQNKGNTDKGRWITLNGGRRIFIPEGSPKDFVKKTMGKGKK